MSLKLPYVPYTEHTFSSVSVLACSAAVRMRRAFCLKQLVNEFRPVVGCGDTAVLQGKNDTVTTTEDGVDKLTSFCWKYPVTETPNLPNSRNTSRGYPGDVCRPSDTSKIGILVLFVALWMHQKEIHRW